MPAQTQSSQLGKKLGARLVKAHSETKDKPAESQGGGEVPAGVEGGIAKLVGFSVSPMKKGKHVGQEMLSLQAVAVSPDFLPNGQKVSGLRTSWMVPLCDTPERKNDKRFEDHWEKFENLLKLLAGEEAVAAVEPTGKTDAERGQSVMDQMFGMAKDLIDAGVTFSFRTWIGEATAEYPNPRTNHVWDRACEWSPTGAAADPGGGVEGGEAPVDEAPVEDPAPDETPAEEPVQEGEDLQALVDAADADPTGKTPNGRAACQRLTELAKTAGMDQDAIDNSQNWGEVAEYINSAGAGAEEAAEPEAPKDPAKGDVVKYAARGKDGKPLVGTDKKPIKATDHELLTVSAKTSTVTLKRLSDEKVVIGADKKPVNVPWDHLEPA